MKKQLQLFILLVKIKQNCAEHDFLQIIYGWTDISLCNNKQQNDDDYNSFFFLKKSNKKCTFQFIRLLLQFMNHNEATATEFTSMKCQFWGNKMRIQPFKADNDITCNHTKLQFAEILNLIQHISWLFVC